MIACAPILSAVFAALAAMLWLGSTLIHLPVLDSAWGTLISVMRDGSKENSAEPFYRAMKRITRLNFAAAACSFLSALFQAIALSHKA